MTEADFRDLAEHWAICVYGPSPEFVGQYLFTLAGLRSFADDVAAKRAEENEE